MIRLQLRAGNFRSRATGTEDFVKCWGCMCGPNLLPALRDTCSRALKVAKWRELRVRHQDVIQAFAVRIVVYK